VAILLALPPEPLESLPVPPDEPPQAIPLPFRKGSVVDSSAVFLAPLQLEAFLELAFKQFILAEEQPLPFDPCWADAADEDPSLGGDYACAWLLEDLLESKLRGEGRVGRNKRVEVLGERR
jgi:hypothetical protein